MDTAGIWVLLVAGGFVVLAFAGLAALSRQPRQSRPDRARLRAEADELGAHASAVEAEAARAAAAAVEAREAALAAERHRDQAWAAQETAERAYDRALRAAVAGRRDQGAHGAEPADRERDVSRAALSAYRRGDISVHELQEVFRRAGDWDPAQEQRERIADRSRADQAAARRAYDRAAAAVRRADDAARIAEVAAQALLDEAAESAAEAQEALLAAQARAGDRRRIRRTDS
nr:hypothetical protein [Micromonospora sp. DSM 115978]